MKIKAWIKNLIYIIIIFFIIMLKEYVDKLFSASYYRYEIRATFCYAVISLLLGVCIGLFLGLEHLITQIKIEGNWKINFPKLILVGMPSLYFSLTNIWFFCGSQFMKDIIAYPSLYFLRYGTGYVSLFQMVLGYVVITSFFKYSEIN